MHIIWYILLVILGISVLVITHELGHYLMGKWLGFTITEFSVGLGPKLFGIKGKETEFTLRRSAAPAASTARIRRCRTTAASIRSLHGSAFWSCSRDL